MIVWEVRNGLEYGTLPDGRKLRSQITVDMAEGGGVITLDLLTSEVGWRQVVRHVFKFYDQKKFHAALKAGKQFIRQEATFLFL